MRTEAILSKMEKVQKRNQRKYIIWRLMRGILRMLICLIGGAVVVFVSVPIMDSLMQSWGSRVAIEANLCFFGFLWLVSKVYGMDDTK